MMIPPEKATSRIIHFEILPGLPGVGPSPKHFHQGRPTPWSEGFVVRFWNSDGSHWVGNFQQGNYGYHDVVLWPEANAIVVVALRRAPELTRPCSPKVTQVTYTTLTEAGQGPSGRRFR